ncbi:hypothetical protein C0995_003549, partial [Termitomyces sp. Mi166
MVSNNDDDEDNPPPPIPPTLPDVTSPAAQRNEPTPQELMPQEPAPQEPCQSGQIQTPTTKTKPDNPAMTCMERAIQESRKAGEQICAARAEEHLGRGVVQPDIPPGNTVTQNNLAKDPTKPDL